MSWALEAGPRTCRDRGSAAIKAHQESSAVFRLAALTDAASGDERRVGRSRRAVRLRDGSRRRSRCEHGWLSWRSADHRGCVRSITGVCSPRSSFRSAGVSTCAAEARSRPIVISTWPARRSRDPVDRPGSPRGVAAASRISARVTSVWPASQRLNAKRLSWRNRNSRSRQRRRGRCAAHTGAEKPRSSDGTGGSTVDEVNACSAPVTSMHVASYERRSSPSTREAAAGRPGPTPPGYATAACPAGRARCGGSARAERGRLAP